MSGRNTPLERLRAELAQAGMPDISPVHKVIRSLLQHYDQAQREAVTARASRLRNEVDKLNGNEPLAQFNILGDGSYDRPFHRVLPPAIRDNMHKLLLPLMNPTTEVPNTFWIRCNSVNLLVYRTPKCRYVAIDENTSAAQRAVAEEYRAIVAEELELILALENEHHDVR